MKHYRFILVVEGPHFQAEPAMDALFQAGCDDAAVGRVGAVQYLDFDREAETLATAVAEATESVENAVPEARVVHLEPDELVTMERPPPCSSQLGNPSLVQSVGPRDGERGDRPAAIRGRPGGAGQGSVRAGV
jgi:hypothetical protein